MEKKPKIMHWCFKCSKEIEAVEKDDEISCTLCKSTFVEEIIESDNHPSTFKPNIQDNKLTCGTLSTLYISSNFPHSYTGGQFQVNLNNLVQMTQPIMAQFLQSHNISNLFNTFVDTNETSFRPASKEEISRLSKEVIDKLNVEKFSIMDCCICSECFKEGEIINNLECGHYHHLECILLWLKKHNNCPVCRYELKTDDIQYELKKKKR